LNILKQIEHQKHVRSNDQINWTKGIHISVQDITCQSMQNRGNQSELPLVSGAPVALSASLHITDSISES
jgi:hypothetical protein